MKLTLNWCIILPLITVILVKTQVTLLKTGIKTRTANKKSNHSNHLCMNNFPVYNCPWDDFKLQQIIELWPIDSRHSCQTNSKSHLLLYEPVFQISGFLHHLLFQHLWSGWRLALKTCQLMNHHCWEAQQMVKKHGAMRPQHRHLHPVQAVWKVHDPLSLSVEGSHHHLESVHKCCVYKWTRQGYTYQQNMQRKLHKKTSKLTLRVSVLPKPKQPWQEWGRNLLSVTHKVSGHHLHHEWHEWQWLATITSHWIHQLQQWVLLSTQYSAQNSLQAIT